MALRSFACCASSGVLLHLLGLEVVILLGLVVVVLGLGVVVVLVVDVLPRYLIAPVDQGLYAHQVLCDLLPLLHRIDEYVSIGALAR